MSLDRVLHGMLSDRATETSVREVLHVMTDHPQQWFSAADMARRVGRPESWVSMLLSKLHEGFVVQADGPVYRIDPDPVVDLDVRRFLRRSEVHSQLAQDNLARFRDRYGHR